MTWEELFDELDGNGIILVDPDLLADKLDELGYDMDSLVPGEDEFDSFFREA